MKQVLPLFRQRYTRVGRLFLIRLIALLGVFSALGSGRASAQALTISGSSGTVCAGTGVALTATGCPTTGTVRWSTNQTGPSITVTPSQTTSYTATCSVAGSTTATTTSTATTTVPIYPAVVLTFEQKAISCNGRSDGQLTLNASGGAGTYQYQFNNQPFQTAKIFDKLAAATYPVAVKDSRGCVLQTNVEVKQPAPVSLSVTAVGAKCTGGADGGIVAVASGGNGGYRYFLGNTPGRESGIFPDLKAGTYTLAAIDRLECAVFQEVTIGAPAAFDVKVDVKPTKCVGSSDGSLAVSATGGTGTYQYQLNTGAFQPGPQFTGLAATNYDLTVKDANGCETKKAVVVTQPEPLKLSVVAAPVNCYGPNSGTITASSTGGTGAVTYQLTTVRTPQSSPVFGGLAVGAYSVVGTDANGCTGVASVTVGQSEPLKAQATTMAASCCVCPTGAVSLTSTGGSGTKRQYQIIGQAYQPGNQIGGLRPNTYRLRVADEVGCTDSIAAVVTNANAITLTTGAVKQVSCAGGADGEATMQVASGSKPYSFFWQTEQRDTLKSRAIRQTGLKEGTYTVSVLDSNGCTAPTTTVTLRALAPLPTRPSVSQSGGTLTAGQSEGLQWYVRTGTDPAKPVENATQPTLIPYQSGQYYAVVTQNGCPSPPSDVINFVLTAVDEPGNGLSLRVVPNPVVDRLRLEIEQTGRSAVQLHLLDASGRAVWQNELPAFTGRKQAEWPLSGVSTGRYLLRARAGERQSVIRVVVE